MNKKKRRSERFQKYFLREKPIEARVFVARYSPDCVKTHVRNLDA